MQGNDYDALVVINSIDSPLILLKELKEYLNRTNIIGTILIDQILHSGNTNERYIYVNFEENNIILLAYRKTVFQEIY